MNDYEQQFQQTSQTLHKKRQTFIGMSPAITAATLQQTWKKISGSFFWKTILRDMMKLAATLVLPQNWPSFIWTVFRRKKSLPIQPERIFLLNLDGSS